MKAKDTTIDIAGLMRCCLVSVQELDPESPVHEGQHVPCKWCPELNSGMVLIGSTWQPAWIHLNGEPECCRKNDEKQ